MLRPAGTAARGRRGRRTTRRDHALRTVLAPARSCSRSSASWSSCDGTVRRLVRARGACVAGAAPATRSGPRVRRRYPIGEPLLASPPKEAPCPSPAVPPLALAAALALLAPAAALRRGQAGQGSEEVAGRRPAAHAARRGEDLQGPQGQGRPRRVPEDLLGAPRPRPGDARERVPDRVRGGEGRGRHASTGSAARAGARTPTAGGSTSCSGAPDDGEERARRTRRGRGAGAGDLDPTGTGRA